MTDRKALRRAYKETPRPMGVYAVRNTVDGMVLLGGSTDLPGMLNRQRFQLENHASPYRQLQADWDRLGEGAFGFEVLDTLEPPDEPGFDATEDLAQLVEMWRERLGLAEEQLYRR